MTAAVPISASPAQALAERLHAAQLDKGGRPYVEHLAAVVAILLRRWPDATTTEVEAAWLHDAFEDTDATRETLLTAGVSPEAADLVDMLSRPPGMAYRQWIANLANSGNRSVLRIKLADNEHNSDPRRRLPGSDIVERRYLPAKEVLERAALMLEPRHGG